MEPQTPNPYLSMLPAGVEPDWDYWRSMVPLHPDHTRQLTSIHQGHGLATEPSLAARRCSKHHSLSCALLEDE